MKDFIATKNDEGRSLFKYLIKMLSDVPISRIEKLFRKKDIKVNGTRSIKKDYKILVGDKIQVFGIVSKPEIIKYKADIKFGIVYEDNNILVINKPRNIQMHSFKNSIDEQVLTYLKFVATDSFEPTHIGRLDKVTTGLVVYAKNYASLIELEKKWKDQEKIYIFKSDLDKPQETNFKITKDIRNERMTVATRGVITHTRFFFDKEKKYAQIYTGKKHQIRVSLSKLGFPIYGDTKYGGKKMSKVYLHSYQIFFHNLKAPLEYLNNESIMVNPDW